MKHTEERTKECAEKHTEEHTKERAETHTEEHSEQENYTYILQCADGSLYTGWTNDLQRRLKAHNAGTASKYTRTRRPVKMIYHETFSTKQEAMKREYAIKQMCRAEKMELIHKVQNETLPD